MMTEHAIAIRQEADLQPTELLSAILQAAINPAMDVMKMERLLDMHERITKEQQRLAFQAAFIKLKPELPVIKKNGAIIVKGQTRSKYSKYEDIDDAITPIINPEGFSFTFRSEAKNDGKQYLVCADLMHRDGHTEPYSILLPVDNSDFRSPVQNVASTISFGKRILVINSLNLVQEGEDDVQGLKPIGEGEQARDIHILISDAKADKVKFLQFMGVESVEAIPVRDVHKAVKALKDKMKK